MYVGTVGMLTGATLTALSARGNLNRAESLDRSLSRMLDQAATTDFAALASNSGWDVPDICDGELSGIGTAAASCPVVDGVTYRVTWSAAFTSDAAGGDGRPTDGGDAITLSATATRADGSTTARSRSVGAPTAGWRAAAGLLRVTLTGDYEGLDSPILLTREADPATIVAAGRADDTGTVLLRGDATACRASSPCRVSLSTGDQRGYTPTHSLSAGSVVGAAGQIVLVPGVAVDASVPIFERGTVDIAVNAVNGTSNRRMSQTEVPPALASVCLWVSFYDGYENQHAPVCNSSNARYVSLDTYAPDGAQPNLRLPFPGGSVVQLNSDLPGATTCPVIAGQRYYQALPTAGWVTVGSAGVCSSWTWGRPTTVGQLGGTTAPFPDAAVQIPRGSHRSLEMTFSGVDALPATGVDNGPLWAKPRAATCAASASCVPAAANPEADCSPAGTLCYSNVAAAPVVTAVNVDTGTQRWPFAATTAAGATTDFSVTSTNVDGGTYSMELLSQPDGATGELRGCPADYSSCATLPDGYSLVIDATPAATTTYWRYTSSAEPAYAASFRLKLTSSVTGVSRTEEIGLPSSNGGWVADPLRLRIGQSTTDSLDVLVRDENGDVAEGAEVGWSGAPAGMTIADSTATTDADGVATTVVDAGTAPEGSYELAVTVSGRTFTQEVVVAPRLASLAVTAGDGAQGASAPYSLVAADASGAVAVGWTVSLAAEMDDAPADGVFFAPAACVTDLDGACSGSAQVSAAAVRGPWQLRARSTGVEGADGGDVTPLAGRVTGTATLTQTEAKDLRLIVLDGAGSVLTGAPVAMAPTDGYTFSPASGVTDDEGVFVTEVTAAGSSTIGAQRPLSLTSGSLSQTVYVTVLGKPATLTSAVAALTIEPGSGPRAVSGVRAVTAGSVDVPYTSVTADFDIPDFEGEKVTSQITTDAAGVGTAHVDVPAGAPSGTYSLTLRVAEDPSVQRVVTVTVT